MVTAVFPSFKPLCDKGDIIQKLYQNFFSYDSAAALERRKYNTGYMKKEKNWRRKHYVIGPLVTAGLFLVVSWLTLAIRPYANPPYTDQ